MRLTIKFSIEFGNPKPEPESESITSIDNTGYLVDTGIQTGLGFTGPGPKIGDE